MIITTVVLLIAVLFLVSARDGKSGEVNMGILGCGIVALCLAGCMGLSSVAGLDSEMKDLLLAGLGVVGGGLLVWAMMMAFSNSSPMSENWGEYMLFGWFKWDDYAELLIWGAVICVASAAYLYAHAGHSLYVIDKNSRYRAALEEIHAQDKAMLAAKTKAITVKAQHSSKKSHKH